LRDIEKVNRLLLEHVEMETVVACRCLDYKKEDLKEKVKFLFDPFGGLKSHIKKGQRVLLKVNLLMDKPPEAAVTTHPLLVKAVAEMVVEAGGIVVIGDSPGGPFSKTLLKRAYEKTGLVAVAQELGAELNYNTEQIKVPFEEGRYSKSFVLGKYLTDADFIINMPKLKTHGLTLITGAVKNLFGAIPGLLKAEYHLKMPDILSFSEMLVDLALCIKPGFNIMDAVIGMEGAGPSAGEPRNYGYLLGGISPLAVDVVAAYLMGISPLSKVSIIKVARERGLVSDIAKVNLVGDSLVPDSDVKIPEVIRSSNLLDRKLPEPLATLLKNLLRPGPVFNHHKCVGCGDCYRSCPATTIEMINKKAKVNLDNCIRCFCCQELCQHQAVSIKRPFLGKLLKF
jgi:uncharacterized protein (DUF362 family)/Pyruvate/2-oxoacid:ferredoxin oxidoreductase delta subunit